MSSLVVGVNEVIAVAAVTIPVIAAIQTGMLSVNDRIVDIKNLGNVMANKIVQDPKITVSLKSDNKSRMQLITEVHTQLRNAQALKLNYSTLTKTNN